MDRLIIAEELLEQMVSHCRAGYPHEACGMLAGRKGRVEKVYAMTNDEPSPVSYLVNPREQFLVMKEMRARGLELVGIFHSHPSSPAFPSVKDVNLALYPDSAYVILSLSDPEHPDIRAYEIRDGRVVGLPLEQG
ncbi:MAG: M67 family metallopeptidase [Nitrospiraceae bacterium]|nr:M67 family metallopeptidase [Nitrospiraceae bacterium]